MFKVGDKVKLKPNIAKEGVSPDTIYYVEKYINSHMFGELIMIKNSWIEIEGFQLIDSDAPVISQWAMPQIKPCTCESRTLFIKGCVCGHLTRRAG